MRRVLDRGCLGKARGKHAGAGGNGVEHIVYETKRDRQQHEAEKERCDVSREDESKAKRFRGVLGVVAYLKVVIVISHSSSVAGAISHQSERKKPWVAPGLSASHHHTRAVSPSHYIKKAGPEEPARWGELIRKEASAARSGP